MLQSQQTIVEHDSNNAKVFQMSHLVLVYFCFVYNSGHGRN